MRSDLAPHGTHLILNGRQPKLPLCRLALSSVVVLISAMLWLETRPLWAITINYQQNANGQAYFYDFNNGHTAAGNFSNNNNWSQQEVTSDDGFGDLYMSDVSNWSTAYYPGSAGDPNPASDDVDLGAFTVNGDATVTIGTLNIASTGA